MSIDAPSLKRFRDDPVGFIEQHLFDPDTNRPFKLLDAEKIFLQHGLMFDDDARLVHSEQVYAAIKKSGKTWSAAIYMLTMIVLFGGRHVEAYCVANDLEQAASRVFEACRRIVEASPLLRRETRITADKITFVATGATIIALASNYESAAGAHPMISVFDELWGYTSERSRRLWDEMVPVPTRKISCRFVSTHAGFEGESLLLKSLYDRGLQQAQIGRDLYSGDGLLMFWSHEPIAPWQTEKWLAEMRRSLRPNQYARMIENRFVTTESTFIDLANYDRCVDPGYRPIVIDRSLPVWCGIDASYKHDYTALCAVTWDRTQQRVRLVAHRIFRPTSEQPIDFEEAIEQTLFTWKGRYQVKSCVFDPFQMIAVAQRLAREGIRMEEFNQTNNNLTEASQNLFELIQGRNLLVYPDAEIRRAVTRAVAIEGPRGWRIGKDKQTHKIDIVVALAMASLACVRAQNKGRVRLVLMTSGDGLSGGVEVDPVTLRPINEQRSRLVRDGDGVLRLVGDNSCWPSEQPRSGSYGVRGCY